MAEREYRVSSVYKVKGTAIIYASSAIEAIEKGMRADELGIEFDFSAPYGETKMRAVLLPEPSHE